MGHSRADKAESHHRIVRMAAARFRETGVDGVGVADLMKDAGLTHGDRKSTRLNSSHANISYAVFCLKKKNRRKIMTSYTPYQPEVVLGTIQMLFEFQSNGALISVIVSPDASMYDCSMNCADDGSVLY